MNSDEIRKSFTKFFIDNKHIEKKSSSLIPNDPTLLLTAAGMVQFKDYFLGNKTTKENKLTTIQKCVRTSDIEIIGETTRHLSFFEMLGNFSIADYFKKDAIKYAHSYITNTLNIPEELLWYTVYKDDQEAKSIWIDEIGISEKRIQSGDEDNFWHMNIPGPCGPCTEIFYDRGEKYGEQGGPIKGSEDRYIEIWNLVFMELIQNNPYEVVGTLPNKNVDTGMGLERLAMVLQDKESIFETDLFLPIINQIESLHDVEYGSNNYVDKQVRVISDHIRASTFLLADGVVPTNENRGYILRRLIRRSLRSSSQLNKKHNDISSIINTVIDNYKQQYPELDKNRNTVFELFINEQMLFYKTLKKGELLVKDLIDKNKTITSNDAYKLYDTYGFPFELTEEIAKENNITINKEDYDVIVRNKKEVIDKVKQSHMTINNIYDPTQFVGYEHTEAEALVTGMEKINKDELIVFTDVTSLYFESGGQVSDRGKLLHKDQQHNISNTIQMPNGAIGNVIKSDIELNIKDKVKLIADKSFREGSSKSHTAAHIVHSSLRKILGDTVSQAGSSVEPGKLRFDFSYSKKVSQESLNEIFELSNTVIFNNTTVETNVMNIEEAKKQGALAFFGDKYDEDVRVVDIGDHSKELCGGTHVVNSSNIGLVVLTNESSIGSNLRRVEMLSGLEAYEFLTKAKKSYTEAASILGVQEEKVITKLQNVIGQYEDLSKSIKENRKTHIENIIKDLKDKVKKIEKIKVIIEQVEIHNSDEAKKITSEILNNTDTDIIIVANNIDGKTLIVGAVNKNTDIDVSKYVSKASKKVSGGASKDPKYSVGGGPGDYNTEDLLNDLFDLVKNELS